MVATLVDADCLVAPARSPVASPVQPALSTSPAQSSSRALMLATSPPADVNCAPVATEAQGSSLLLHHPPNDSAAKRLAAAGALSGTANAWMCHFAGCGKAFKSEGRLQSHLQ